MNLFPAAIFRTYVYLGVKGTDTSAAKCGDGLDIVETSTSK